MNDAAKSPPPRSPETVPGPAALPPAAGAQKPAFTLRPYQEKVFWDNTTGILILHRARQIGKSHTLAKWAMFRLLKQLETNPTWLITVLSNSRENGAEFCLKVAETCRAAQEKFETSDDSAGFAYQDMRMELRLTRRINQRDRVGRIKVLAANPRTARGFSGHLILDEFAFHQDSLAIWEAAEPILSANAEYLCRIASTGNGRHNLFYRMAAGPGPDNGEFFQSAGGFKVSRVTRTEAWRMGVAIYDPHTRQPVTPAEARRKSLDKRAYDQNYECEFGGESMGLLTQELVARAERAGIPIDHQQWSAASLARLAAAEGGLFLGGDIGRRRDITVFAMLERVGPARKIIAMLRMADLRLPQQQRQLDRVCALPKFRTACIDMSGLGLGLVEYAQEKHGPYKVRGVDFATTEPINERIHAEGRKAETAKVTEIMATNLLACFEEGSLEICVELDDEAREDLRKPEKITSPSGRVSIAAARNEAGHADHFWAFALAVRAAASHAEPGAIGVFENTRASRALAERRERTVMG